jgi:hypothetical protein
MLLELNSKYKYSLHHQIRLIANHSIFCHPFADGATIRVVLERVDLPRKRRDLFISPESQYETKFVLASAGKITYISHCQKVASNRRYFAWQLQGVNNSFRLPARGVSIGWKQANSFACRNGGTMRGLRSWLEQVGGRGDLLIITKELDWNGEAAALVHIMRQSSAAHSGR